jgi:hypothetical protein
MARFDHEQVDRIIQPAFACNYGVRLTEPAVGDDERHEALHQPIAAKILEVGQLVRLHRVTAVGS